MICSMSKICFGRIVCRIYRHSTSVAETIATCREPTTIMGIIEKDRVHGPKESLRLWVLSRRIGLMSQKRGFRYIIYLVNIKVHFAV